MSVSPVSEVSTPATRRLAEALESWVPQETYFLTHLAFFREGAQDAVMSDAKGLLDAVACEVDESYKGWWALERECGTNYEDVKEFIERAINRPATV